MMKRSAKVSRLPAITIGQRLLSLLVIGLLVCPPNTVAAAPLENRLAASAPAPLAAAGVTIAPTSINVTEGGSAVSYTIVLNEAPTANVTITITPNLPSQVTVTPGSMEFTTTNWNTPQSASVSAVDDSIDEGAHTAAMNHTAASTDTNYNGLVIAPLAVTITDNDTAGLTLAPTSANVSEGSQITYTLQLATQPVASVVVSLASDSQVSVTPATLTFSTGTWNTPQTVTLTPVDDLVAEGDHTGEVTHSASSGDPKYQGLTASFTANITDNDTAAVVLTPTSLNLTEGNPLGSSYSVQLNSQPTGPVTVTIVTNTQVLVNQTVLNFSSSDWNTPQQILINAIDDPDAEGTHTTVVTHTTTSTDTFYLDLEALLAITITDNDNASIIYTPTTLSLAEGSNQSQSYSVRLSSRPRNPVTINITTPDGQTTVSPNQLSFSKQAYDVPQTVTVYVVDDPVDEPDPHTGEVRNLSSSNDSSYDNLLTSITVNISDNDTAAVIVNPTSLSVTEGQPAVAYNVRLATQPTSTVTINLAPAPATQLTATPAQLTFTTSNWNTPQSVQVAAVDDSVDEDTQAGSITHTAQSSDPNYSGIAIAPVSVTIEDNDTAGISYNPTTVSIGEDGTKAIYTIWLDTQPSGSVTINIGQTTQATTAPTQLTFTPANWSQPQQVEVSAVNDFVDEGDHSTQLSHGSQSTDLKYNGLIFIVTAQITDNDFAGITLIPAQVNLTEGGPAVIYRVVLDSQPTQPVTITLSYGSELSASLNQLVFTSANWNAPRNISLSAPENFIAHGPRDALVIHNAASNDPKYQGLSDTLTAHITDNDTAGILISTLEVYVMEGSYTDIYTISLTSEPTSLVTINLTPDNQLTLNTISLDFDSTNWNTGLAIIVSAFDDQIHEGTHAGVITHASSSSDPNYNGVSIPNVNAVIGDNDSPGIFLRPSTITIAENSPTVPVSATYQAELTTQPIHDVVISLVPSPQFTTSRSSFLFTSQNWNVPQTIAVTAVDDRIAEGTEAGGFYALTLLRHTASSEDGDYHDMDVASLNVRILDNDTPGIEIFPTHVLTTTESGGTVTFTLKLSSQPTNTVTLVFESHDPTEGQVYDPFGWALTFYTSTWDIPQFLTIIGIDDNIDDETIPYTITVTAASPDLHYDKHPTVIRLVNLDNDGPQISVADISVVEKDTEPIKAIFTIQLDHPTAQDVSFRYRTASGTALAGSDFLPATGIQVIPAGQTTAQVEVTVLGDVFGESSETFYLELYQPTGDATIATSRAACVIFDNDPILTFLPFLERNHTTLFMNDDFSRALGWNMINEAGASAYLDSGSFHITHSLPNRNVRVIAPASSAALPASYAVRTSLSLAPGSDPATRAGILFNWVDQFHFYRFLVQPSTQEFWIYKFQQTWVLLAKGTSSAILPGGSNELLLVRDGRDIHAYANDALLVSLINESTYLTGGVGLTILSSPDLTGANLAHAVFDYFILREYSR